MEDIYRVFSCAIDGNLTLPPKQLWKYIPLIELISSAYGKSLREFSTDSHISYDQLSMAYRDGCDKSSARAIIVNYCIEGINRNRTELSNSEYLNLISLVNSYNQSKDWLKEEEVSLDFTGTPSVIKFDSGYKPLDVLTGGLYQGIMTLVAKPGHGKTSHALSIAKAFRESGVGSILFLQTELSAPVMHYKLSLMEYNKWQKGRDKFICGLYDDNLTKQAIINHYEEYGNDMVVIHDCQDTLFGNVSNGGWAKYTDFYQMLVSLKPTYKLAILTSQMSRGSDIEDIDSTSGSVSKGRYSDIMVGITKGDSLPNNNNKVFMSCTKNRLGTAQQKVVFSYDYQTLKYKDDVEPVF